MYFGCGREAGHYLWDQYGHKITYGPTPRRLNLDGVLAPQPEKDLYVASFSRLGGWGLSALSWWDRSVDRRPASNSIIYAPSLTITPEEMLAASKDAFPWVFARLPQELVLA